MTQLLSLLFLLQIMGSCNKILSCEHSYTPINISFNNFKMSYGPSVPGTRYLNPVQQDPWLIDVEKHLYSGTLTEEFVDKNKVDVTKPQIIVRDNRCDTTRHTYLIEHVINQRYPMDSFETLLKTGTHVDGMIDYSPIAHILQRVVTYCGTKTIVEDNFQSPKAREQWQRTANTRLALYQEYLQILFKHKVDLTKEFPEQDGDGEISKADLGEGPINALTFLHKAREFKKKDGKLLVFDEPFDTIQAQLEQELKSREIGVKEPHTIKKLSQPNTSFKRTWPGWVYPVLFNTVAGLGICTALFFATRWQYPGFFNRLTLPKMPTLLKHY